VKCKEVSFFQLVLELILVILFKMLMHHLKFQWNCLTPIKFIPSFQLDFSMDIIVTALIPKYCEIL